MHYFPFHIGDYDKDTGHLSLIEHGAYLVLLKWQYATEKPLPNGDGVIHRLCRANSRQEKDTVDAIVKEFFPGGWNKRALTEIKQYRYSILEKRIAGLMRQHSTWSRKEAVDFINRSPPADQPLTTSSATRARVPLTMIHDPLTSGANGVEPGLGNGLKKSGGLSTAQAIYLLDRDLAEVNEKISECDELVQPVPPELKQRRDDLQKKRTEMTT